MTEKSKEKKSNSYKKPQIYIANMETENGILNSSNPTGSVPDMPWEKSRENEWISWNPWE